ncbi:c-type cytochrome biogenesis protein CcmI [Paracoccus alkanivorans]|uniref:C-type cytochrome biogenesis protein CcmI n=1 Tax=Paracoccus alkanivorans TaxID=2116655 RepID=A0A3M0M984_9RHOB|nr:c-type cytochrome biogenesis protein CcmI [Paracoccus alkanivorans]RMC32894.1 c-type cytochrome biogenesis protein CcmI [Paracoccus alkanivorans]
MFWLLCALLTLVVAAAIAAPLRRARDTGAPSAAAYDLRVYRDQLREVERDLERGVIGGDEAGRLRNEIGRKVLDADRRLAEPSPSRHGGKMAGAGIVLLLLLAGAFGLYLYQGAPTAPDLPLSKRIAAAERAYDDRPNQAEAEAAAPERDKPKVDDEYVALVEQLREAVAKTPDDPQGLTLLATNEMRLGNMIAAREAQQRLVDLRGDQASAQELLRLSALMIEAAGGLITPEAEEVLARALQKDRSLPQGRYLLGLLQLQNGRPDRAFPVWRQLLEEGPYDAPWNAPIRAGIRDLAWLAGHPDYVPPEPEATGMPALPGPDADAVAAAEDMTGEERQEMIENMVAGLESRLATEGGSPEEWARLIGSLAVLGQTDRARAIWNEAQQRFGATPEAIAPIRAAAEKAGLIE